MFRLGVFLFYRISKIGKDSRFDRMRNSPSRLFITWMMQGKKIRRILFIEKKVRDFLLSIGIWVIITLLPTLYLNQKLTDKPLTKTDFLGWSIWLFGFLFEVLADKQKMTFKNNPNNKVIIFD